MKLYADEDISREVVTFLREKAGCNVVHVVDDERLRGRDDTYHYAEAGKRRRTLLTRDERYMDNRAFPLQQSPGVIILETGQQATPLRQVVAFFRVLPVIKDALKYAPDLKRMKCKVASAGYMIEFIDYAGQRVRIRS